MLQFLLLSAHGRAPHNGVLNYRNPKFSKRNTLPIEFKVTPCDTPARTWYAYSGMVKFTDKEEIIANVTTRNRTIVL